MRRDWESCHLVDLCSLIKRGLAPKYCDTGGVPVLNQRCIRDFVVSFDNARRHDLTKKNVPNGRFLESFDILVNSTGVGTLGRVAQIGEVNRDITVDSHVTIVRGKAELIHKKYLGYVLKSKEAEIEFMGHGSTGQTELSRHRLGELIIRYPKSIGEQKAIAHMLGTLDDKIELNRRMNETLEQMAQALFKSWFVDFDPVLDKALAAGNDIPEALQQKAERRKEVPDEKKLLHTNPELIAAFPDRFRYTEELGWIPEGWEVRSLPEMATYLNGTACQKHPPQDENDKLPVLKIRELRNGISDSSDFASSMVDEKYIVEAGDIIFSWSGTLMVKIWSGEKCVLNQHLFKVFSESYPSWFIYSWTKFHLDRFIYIAASKATTMGHIKRSDLKASKVLNPGSAFISQLDKIFSPLFEKINLLNENSNDLINLRDTLLPKLISGELAVPEVEKIIAEHV